jgi:GNAT superfamily N-acetyltransferase
MTIIKSITASETWPIRHAVMWPDHPLEFVKLERDETDGLHVGLFVDGELTSIVSVFIDDTALQFRKFATLKSQQGKGYGSELLRYVTDVVAPDNDIEKIWCNARVEKADYYRKFGLEKTELRYLKGGVEFVVMERS